MEFLLTPSDRIARARTDLRVGLPVVLRNEDQMVLLMAAETALPERFASMRGGTGLALAITSWRAATLKARAYDGDLARIDIPTDAGLKWIQAIADPSDDLIHPMKGPFKTQRDGDPVFARAGILLAKSAHLLPAVLTVPTVFAPADLTVLDIAQLASLKSEAPSLTDIVAARLPIEAGETRLHVFRPDNGAEEHYAVEVGSPARNTAPLTRLHSACFTGDVLGSLKCDCGPQLHAALAAIGAAGSGVLLYLNQEGRGIGLVNKMRAYSLQDQGFDTVQANHRLGFEDDERDFRIGASILKNLGFSSVRLLTNNPAKVEMLSSNGISVSERVPLKAGETPQNAGYLATKAAKSGHLL